ncbi:heterokaryon incompatibility protein-domain-containing protein [Pisolithus thermaeus]|nr:heterokaryon incompatibility protein-domain-containing protein [Pisolithus thermaeus]
MHLIDVCVLLEVEGNISRGLSPDTETRILVDFHGSAVLAGSEYAILSHCWDVPEKGEKEVHFKELKKLTTMKPHKRDEIRKRGGYHKILDTCRRADKDGLRWAWVDSCCINRESSSELSEAINSMFRWYENSRLCYVYLQDVEGTLPTESNKEKFPESGGWPKWFSRGWTLQELVAPRTVHFFDQGWKFIGNKQELADTLKAITRIPRSVLKDGIGSPRPCAAQILSWAADRRTTRVEDIAYSLLGLLDVNMPMLYGEGKEAFQRLQEEIIRRFNDHSIFAWDPDGKDLRTTSVLADGPSHFRGCHNIKRVEFDEFVRELKEVIVEEELCQARLQMFSVTNGGIQIWLPLTPYHNCPSIFKATLACRRYGALVTIDLAPWKTKYYRYCGASGTLKSCPMIQQVFLAHQDDVHDNVNFELDDRTIAYYGFSYCSSFPPGVTNGSVTLTRSNPLTVVMYNRDSAHFAVVFGWCFGQEWVHVKSGMYMKEHGHSYESYVMEIYHQAWNMGAEHAHLMADAHSGKSLFYVKHIHLPQSIWAVKIICGAWKKSRRSTVTVDVSHCTGFCHDSLKWRGLKLATNDHDMPGLMSTHWFPGSSSLSVGGMQVEFLHAHQEIQLGDYGYWNQGRQYLEHEGNIFEKLKSLAARLGVDPIDVAYVPIRQRVIDTDMESDDSQSGLTASQQKLSLFTIAQPLVWQSEEANTEMKKLCEDIRKHFNVLVQSVAKQKNNHSILYKLHVFPFMAAQDSNGHQNGDAQKQDAAKFFMGMFGIEHLKDYIGSITFLKHLPRFLDAGVNGGNLSQVLTVMHGPGVEKDDQMTNDRIRILTSKLLQRMPINVDKDCIDQKLWRFEKRKVEHDVEAISKTLGVMLLDTTSAAYHRTQDSKLVYSQFWFAVFMINDYRERGGRPRGNNHLQSMVQEIMTLQDKLDMTWSQPVFEAQEGDIVGKILWTCLHGIHLEIEEVLEKVVHCVLNDSLVSPKVQGMRTELLQEMGNIFKNAVSDFQVDDQPYLWQ